MKGRVVKSTGSWYQVKTVDGTLYDCRIRGLFRVKKKGLTNPVAVGDEVVIEPEAGFESKAIITEICERKNYLIRRANKLSSRFQIIASNIDCILIIATISKPRTTTVFIDRILLAAEAWSIPAKLIFNKRDLYSREELAKADEWISLYSNLGYETILISAFEEIDLELLRRSIQDKISLITGHSGVGKSTILNSLNPNLTLKTGNISKYHQRGMHNTTFAEMHKVFDNTYIIDTPGIKDFGLVELEKDNISLFFKDIRQFAEKCRFNNCSHIDEPECMVVDAVKKGMIAFSRYESYLNIVQPL